MTYLCNNAAFTIPHRAFTHFATITLLLGFALQVWVDIGVPRVDSAPRVDRTLRVDSILGVDRRFLALE